MADPAGRQLADELMPLPRPNLAQIAANPTIGQTAQSERIPSPIGGWNAYDSIAAMEPIYALVMDNMFPTTSVCRVRRGFASWATGMSGQVESLFQWGGPSANKMLAANGGKIYDVSSTGAVGAALASGYLSNRWQSVNFGTPGGMFIVAVNGLDTPWNYNGTVIASTPAITGITPTNIVNICAFKERLFFVQKNSLTYAYLPVNAIGGAALTVDLSSFFELGGNLISIGTWSRAGLTDQQDLIVFLTDQGEFLTFAGSDPADATAWGLQNHGPIGSPVGYRCMMKVGSDLYIICQDGLVALSEVLWLDRVDVSKTISKKIGLALNDAVEKFGSNFGWQPFLYPKGNQAFVNVPATAGTTMYQYVVNTGTGAWCRFLNMNANCWVLYNDKPYFGGTDGKVYEADTGTTDNGANITWQVRSAFIDMGISGQNKQWTFARPVFNLNGNSSIQIDLEVDYSITGLAAPATPSITGATWNSGLWNSALWGGGASVQALWNGGNVIGRVVAVHMRGAAKFQTVEWLATDFTFIQAGLI